MKKTNTLKILQNQANSEKSWDKQMKQCIQKKGVIVIFIAIENHSRRVQSIMISIYLFNKAKIDRNRKSIILKLSIYKKEDMIKIWNLKNQTILLNHKIARRARMSIKINKVKKKRSSKKLLQKNCKRLSHNLSKNLIQKKYWEFKKKLYLQINTMKLNK